ncbi:MAG TPA: hypothetical protein VJU86_07140 [Pyrinomonadaceae bacterium]|nr:hypothetical protein [Pyrinomonadaceae bacterium]
MPNGDNELSVAQRISRGTLSSINSDVLDDARRIAGYKPRAELNQSLGLVGEVAARDWVKREYRGRAREVVVMRRNVATPILDLVFEVGPDEYVVIEAKANSSELGETNRKLFRAADDGGVRVNSQRRRVRQFDPVWFEQKLAELRRHGPEGRKLAGRLSHSWHSGKLRPVLVRTPEAGLRTEHVVIEDFSSKWNAHIGVQGRHSIPNYNVPGEHSITPSTSEPLTNVERGLEAPHKPTAAVHHSVPDSKPHLPSKKLANAGNLGEGAITMAGRGFKARSLTIGVKTWRAARTVGKVLVLCFVPLSALDVVLEVAFALWDRHAAKKEKERQAKQLALEAVFKADKETNVLQDAIRKNIVNNQRVQADFFRTWELNKNYPGFQYARLKAILEVESYRGVMGQESDAPSKYRLASLSVIPTDWAHDLTLETIGEEKAAAQTDKEKAELFRKEGLAGSLKVVKRQKLSYTIVPPLLTPFDIVVTKINNLFLDIAFFVAQFSDSGESMMESFNGFNYRYSWSDQFGLQLQFPSPLKASVCEYCLAYLHYSAKQLSRHALEEQDLEGNLEDPVRGRQRRFWLLQSLLEGSGTRYGKNFADFTKQLKSLVKAGEKDPEVVAALEELYAGARSIWQDLGRIESNMKKPEYYYFGPRYVPGG